MSDPDSERTTRITWDLEPVPPDLLETACRAWHDYGLWPDQRTWDELEQRGDRRIPLWCEKIQAALSHVL